LTGTIRKALEEIDVHPDEWTTAINWTQHPWFPPIVRKLSRLFETACSHSDLFESRSTFND
jgi:hypothetical protein